MPPDSVSSEAARLRVASAGLTGPRAPLPSDAASSPALRDQGSDKRRENGSCGMPSCSCPSKPGAWKGGRVLASLLKDG